MTDKDYWAMFAAAAMTNAFDPAASADRMMIEMKKRFPDPKRHEDHFMGTPISELNEEEKILLKEYRKKSQH
jgi:hypothetical protein